MPIYKQLQKKFYSTRSEVLRIFRSEEKLKCSCQTDTWAGNENKITCFNCLRKWDLTDELKRKEFFGELKHCKYGKVRRQGMYKHLKIAPVYPEPQFVGTVTLPTELVKECAGGEESGEEYDSGWDD